MNVGLTRHLTTDGLDARDIARLVRDHELIRLRRGGYRQASDRDPLAAVRVAVLLTHPDAVISHLSAAAVHGLPLWGDPVPRVHLTRNRSGEGRRLKWIHVHGAPFTDDEVEMVDGIVVTTIPRTMVDLARTLESSRAAVPGDEVVRRGWTTDDLMVAALRATRWPGVRRARRLIPLLDGRSESAGESRSRIVIARLGFPTPQLQQELFDGDGRLVARGDFAWPELQLLGEYDGRMKYGIDNPSGRSPEDVVWSEKIREDAVRDLAWHVVRWTTHHLDHPAELAALLDRAFRRARAARLR